MVLDMETILAKAAMDRVAMRDHSRQVQSGRRDETVHRVLGSPQTRQERGGHAAGDVVVNVPWLAVQSWTIARIDQNPLRR